MAKQRKFTSIHVSNEVNISSTGHYHFNVSLLENGTGKDYCWNPGCSWLTPRKGEIHEIRVPRYVIKTIEDTVRAAHTAGELRFFEYDRDGVKRYADLRYHDAERWASLVSA